MITPDQFDSESGEFIPEDAGGQNLELKQPDLDTANNPADNFNGAAPKPGDPRSIFSRIEKKMAPSEESIDALTAAKRRAAQFEENRRQSRDERLRKLEERIKSQDNFSRDVIYENLENNITRISEAQRGRHFPVKNGRINITEYEGKGFYEGDVVSNDLRELQRARARQSNIKDPYSSGELLEKTAYIIFNEDFPGCDFVRSAEVEDESINKDRFDGILFLDGQALCAVDFTTAKQSQILEQKSKKAFGQNVNGVNIKYCFKKNGDAAELSPEISVPLININGDGEQIMKVLAEMNMKDRQKDKMLDSGRERKIMLYGIVKSIYETLDVYLPDGAGRTMFGRRSKMEGPCIEKLRKLKELLTANYPRADVDDFMYELNNQKSRGKKSKKARAK